MSFLSKLAKSAGTAADAITTSIDGTVRTVTHAGHAIEDQAARWEVASRRSLRETLIADIQAQAEEEAQLASLGIKPETIDERLMQLTGRK